MAVFLCFQVQSNKQAISAMRSRTISGIDKFRPGDTSNRINARWTNEEMLLAVQGRLFLSPYAVPMVCYSFIK